jgi:hypothetical protein
MYYGSDLVSYTNENETKLFRYVIRFKNIY